MSKQPVVPTLIPILQQYLGLKEQNPDCLVFFRLGDFFELFFEDAKIASAELELTLTSRESGLSERAPMCGVPHHAVEGHIAKLLGRGYRVALCEQMAEPGAQKGIIPRECVRIFTPGTVIEPGMLDERRNNFIVALCLSKNRVGLCAADVSTGEIDVCELLPDELGSELTRLSPTELLVNEGAMLYIQKHRMRTAASMVPYAEAAFASDEERKLLFERFHRAADPLKSMPLATRSACALMHYLRNTQKNSLAHMSYLKAYRLAEGMMLDAATRRNLELTETISGRGKHGTLLWLLDRTATSMGGRQLRAWVEMPLRNIGAIQARQDIVEALVSDYAALQDIHERLRAVYDIERLTSRISYGSFNARDALALSKSLSALPGLRDALEGMAALADLRASIDTIDDIRTLLENAIHEEPPIALKEGGLIKDGYHAELDRIRRASSEGVTWIAELEAREREETGIKNLRVGFNKVFGYYIEVTKSNYDQVPYRYTRKQTLANCERYITQELKEIEDSVLGAQERGERLEYELFQDVRDRIAAHIGDLLRDAEAIKTLDALCALALVAIDNRYVRPELHDGDELTIQGGRHPVVERMNEGFVPNDTHLTDAERLMIITGPNMAGKSTYMRQVALIVLLAHIGSFVPADAARIPLCDRIFTRVGASDDVSMGQSTFMVEMTEMADILKHATNRSLLLIDEIGRGTSTFDGLSIAWSVAEYISDPKMCGAKALFATHYHELSELEGRLEGAVNYCITVREIGEDIVFLRRIQRGGSDKSFGIQVARLAGLPPAVIKRARRIMAKLEAADINRETIGKNILGGGAEAAPAQLDLFSPQQAGIVEELRALAVEHMTPMEALQAVYTLHEKAKRA